MEVLIVILVVISALITLAINGVALAFIVAYIFFWQKLREWFNKKAGADFMQEKRLSNEQKPMIYVGLGCGVLFLILSFGGYDDAISNLGSLLGVGVAVLSYLRYKKLEPQVGKSVAKWSSIFYFCSATVVVALTTALAAVAITLYIVLLLMGKMVDLSTESARSSASSGSGIEIKNLFKVTEYGEDVTVDRCHDGSFKDSKGDKYTEKGDGSLHRENL